MNASRTLFLILSCCWFASGQATPLKPIRFVTTPAVNTAKPLADITASQVISSSFRSGNAQELASFFDKQIELLIDTESVNFQEVRSKHAELILATFFKKHPPQGFQYIYQGGSARLRYITGLYQAAGQRFSVYLLMSQDARHRMVINTLHLRKS